MNIFSELATGIGIILKKNQALKVQIALQISYYCIIGSAEAEFLR